MENGYLGSSKMSRVKSKRFFSSGIQINAPNQETYWNGFFEGSKEAIAGLEIFSIVLKKILE